LKLEDMKNLLRSSSKDADKGPEAKLFGAGYRAGIELMIAEEENRLCNSLNYVRRLRDVLRREKAKTSKISTLGFIAGAEVVLDSFEFIDLREPLDLNEERFERLLKQLDARADARVSRDAAFEAAAAPAAERS
jgi:hypothetical protein